MTGGPVTSCGVRRRAASCAGVLLAAVLGLTACGQQPPRTAAADVGNPAADEAQADDRGDVRLGVGEAKPRLWCPRDERSLMIADFAVGARGAPTPQAAVGRSSLEAGEHMVVSSSGVRVWLVRADGTAREEVHLTHLRGWFLHMRTSCV